MTESSLPGRALGSLFLAGATIGLVSLLLPHPRGADEVGLYSNVAVAAAGGVTVFALAARLRQWMLHLILAIGTVLITRAVLLSHDGVSFYSVWFIWVGIYAFYFLSRRGAAVQVAFASALYGFTLLHQHTTTPVARWMTTVATLIVAGVFIDALIHRAKREMLAAAENARRMTLIAEIAHELAGVSESARARPALCDAAARVTHAEGVALWEPSANGSSLLLTASSGARPVSRAIPFAGPPAGAPQAFTTGKTVSATPEAGNPLMIEFRGGEHQPGVGMWQPILRDGAPIAVLGLYWNSTTALEDPSVTSLTDLVAAEAAVTLERVALLARLEMVARTDELTGLPNRRAWQEELPRELKRARRSEQPLCVAMLDLDYFKEYNDERGHQAGDRLLKEIAGSWSGELRATDILARYGGEEFALALPSCEIERAYEIVERLRQVIAAGQTCSAGIALWDGTETATALIERADRALYDAKRSGRDRTQLAADVTPER